MKHPRLTAIFIAVSAASLLMASTASFANHKMHHKVAVEHEQHEHENYKGENLKGEVPPPCPPIMMLHDGFYVGLGVGYDSYRINHHSEFSEIEADATETITVSSNQSATGWMGGIFAGYGRYFDWFYLGAEINGNYSNAKSSFSYATNEEVDSASINIKARGSYGVALLPGVKLNDSSLLYVRLGYLRANFKGNATFVDEDATLSISNNKWRNGFQYGVGIETYVAENISLRGEFDHTTFNSRTASGTFLLPTGDELALTSRLKPSNNEFMLSLLYHFC